MILLALLDLVLTKNQPPKRNNMSKANLSPLHDNLLLEPQQAAEKIGSIIVPENVRPLLTQGKVLDKGPLVSDKIALGDTVFFPMHAENRLAYGDKKYIIVAESGCIAIVQPIK